MKGNFDDDERISRNDTEKKTFGSNSGITIQLLSPFTCLLIGVTQEAEETTLHKDKKNAKETIEVTAGTKMFLIARNISSTETLLCCSHSSSSNMVAVNFPPD